MGQTLSSPATDKITDTGGDSRFLYAVSEMQGWRISMEDAHAVVLDLDGNQDTSNTFFAVYDGHGGGTVARFAGQNVHKRLVNEEAYRSKDYEAALKRAFLGTDEDMLADPSRARDPSGCTAVAALITNDQRIYVANAGDSRSVLSVKGEVKPLSFDHKPSNETEKHRIIAAGGYVDFGRVNGNLALSRALGDFDFKKNQLMVPEKQIITADPDVTSHEITDEDEFLVIACDGIWDCLSSQQVVNFVRLHVSQGKTLAETAELICDHCLAPDTSSNAGIGCDNMTVLIVAFLHGRTKEEWYAWITERVQQGHGYETPSTVPQLYAMSRLLSFRARREAQKARERARLEQQEQQNNNQQDSEEESPSSTPGEFSSRILGSTGGISFHPGSEIMSGNTRLIFVDNPDSDDDESSDEAQTDIRTLEVESESTLTITTVTLGLDNLKACLEDLNGGQISSNDGYGDADADGDAYMEELDGPEDGVDKPKAALKGNIADAAPKSLPNGDLKAPGPSRTTEPVEG